MDKPTSFDWAWQTFPDRVLVGRWWGGWVMEILDIKLNSYRLDLGFVLSSAIWMPALSTEKSKFCPLRLIVDCAPFCGHNEPDSN